MPFTRTLRMAAGAAMAALLLVSCGGGDSSAVAVARLVVAGDSLADAGTYGLKFTVQNAAAPAAGFPIYPEIVADAYEVGDQCNYYVFANGGFSTNPDCTNYAVGGGRIQNPAANGGVDDPRSIPQQLEAAAAEFRTYGLSDMILVDGGGNDAADLVGAYLGAASSPEGAIAYRTFLLQQLDAARLDAALAQPDGAALAAGLYMQRLADTFYAALKTHALDRGARRLVVLNMPDITLTPRFQALLAGISAANGAEAAARLQGAIRQWISAFNTQLEARIDNDGRVVQVDLYGVFTAQVNDPDAFGLDNATDAACPVIGVDAQGLPAYDLGTCTSAALDAAPPPGEVAGWWRSWLFSDGFHPTPYGHQLLADAILDAVGGN